jgi:hypothetical protein
VHSVLRSSRSQRTHDCSRNRVGGAASKALRA